MENIDLILKKIKKYNTEDENDIVDQCKNMSKLEINKKNMDKVWYITYWLSKYYHKKKDYDNMEYWALKGYEISKARCENLMLLVVYFRHKGENVKAYKYLELANKIQMPNFAYELEKNKYVHDRLYEETILSYYVNKKEEGMLKIIEYYNKYIQIGKNISAVLINMRFYTPKFKKTKDLNLFKDVKDYNISVVSNFPTYHKNILTVKYVQDLKIKNHVLVTDKDWNCIIEQKELDMPKFDKVSEQEVVDLSIFEDKEKMKYKGKIFSPSYELDCIFGDYNIEENTIFNTERIGNLKDILSTGERLISISPFIIETYNGEEIINYKMQNIFYMVSLCQAKYHKGELYVLCRLFYENHNFYCLIVKTGNRLKWTLFFSLFDGKAKANSFNINDDMLEIIGTVPGSVPALVKIEISSLKYYTL